MKKLLLILILSLVAREGWASSTITATARSFASASSESFTIAHASQTGLDPGAINWYTCGWVYITSLPASENCLWGKIDNVSAISWSLRVTNANKLLLYIDDGPTFPSVTSTDSIANTTWTFVEAWHVVSEKKIYVNVNRGTPVASSAYSGTAQTSTNPFVVGMRGGALHWNGRMQCIAFYNAIPDDTIKNALYNSGVAKVYQDLTTDQKTNLVSYWNLTETSGNAVDAVGVNNLTDTNTVTSAAGVAQYSALGAADFNEANSEYLSITDAAQSGLSPGDIANDFYVCGWIKLDALDSGGTNIILGKFNNTTAVGNEFSLRYNGTTNLLNFGMYDNTGIDNNDHYIFVGSPVSAVFEFTDWLFFELYLDYSEKTGYISVNRGAEYSDSYTGTGPCAGTNAFRIGIDSNPTAGQYHDGRISNVIFIAGIPTTAERDALFNGGIGCDYDNRPALSSATYTSWWPLTETSGTREDSVGSNDLADVNTVTSSAGIVYDYSATPPATRNRYRVVS